MSDENQEIDPLSADVGDKDLTKFPLIPGDRMLRFEIRKPSLAPSRKDPNRNVLTVPCHLVDDVRADDDTIIHKGFPVFHRIPVTPSEDRGARQIAADVGQLCQAVGVKGVKVIDIINDPVRYLDGKIFDAKTRIVPGKDGYPDSNALRPIALA